MNLILFMRSMGHFKYIRGWMGVCLFVLLAGCHKSEPVKPEADRTILVYLATDNNLDSYARKNIKDMLKGMEKLSGRIVIYMDAYEEEPVLMTIQKRGEEWKLDTIEKYGEEDSTAPEVLRRVANRVRELYPAASYGLVLGSHGSGWIPEHVRFPGQRMAKRKSADAPLTRYFGEDKHRGDGGYRQTGMTVGDLAEALPGGYRFILFDACLMSNIELAYALRHKTEYILASPAEILIDGFPYQRIMPFLWGEEPELREVCREYWNYYENYPSGGGWRSGTIALIRTEFLDGLAEEVRGILAGKAESIAGMLPSEVWRYPLINYDQDVFFDFGEYIRKFVTETQYNQFKVWLDQAVYRLSTTRFNGITIPIEQYSGLSVYIPLGRWETANEEYYELEWAQYVYGE